VAALRVTQPDVRSKTLGITTPTSVLLRADEVIE
jgi:hypothetical protein